MEEWKKESCTLIIMSVWLVMISHMKSS